MLFAYKIAEGQFHFFRARRRLRPSSCLSGTPDFPQSSNRDQCALTRTEGAYGHTQTPRPVTIKVSRAWRATLLSSHPPPRPAPYATWHDVLGLVPVPLPSLLPSLRPLVVGFCQQQPLSMSKMKRMAWTSGGRPPVTTTTTVNQTTRTTHPLPRPTPRQPTPLYRNPTPRKTPSALPLPLRLDTRPRPTTRQLSLPPRQRHLRTTTCPSQNCRRGSPSTLSNVPDMKSEVEGSYKSDRRGSKNI